MNPIQQTALKAGELSRDLNTEEALKNYQEAVKENPENFSAFMGMGRIYLEKEMWEESLYHFLRAEVLKPGPEVYLNMADLFFKKQNYKKAVEYFDKASKSGRPVFEIEWQKGLAYEKMKQKKEAVFCFIKAYELKPETRLCLKIAPLALEARLFKEAVKFYAMAVKIEEKPLYYAEMGLAYMELGQYEESRKCYQKAKELSQLGKAYPKLEELTFEDFVARYPDLDRRIEETTRKVEEGSKDYQDHMDLGNMFFIKGDYQKSAEFYLKARENYLCQMILKL